ncbi:putative BNR repeat neuraminidase [Labedella gwakjiensis]|nr:BNR-4 repeat-containing protein [Labedella gwakjiensis]PSL38664.1 putative BNR repeat neuraminidase [Labedella gwakjiensis]
MRGTGLRRVSAAMTLVLVAGLASAFAPSSPAAAATTLSCPGTPGQTVPAPADLERPEALSAVTVTTSDGTPERSYAGMMLPQAVVHDPAVDRMFIAYYTPGPAAENGRVPVRMAVAAVNASGAVVERTILSRADGTPVLFDQGAATPSSSGGNVDDSHNNITMEIDGLGFVHVAGNAHNDDLPYWRSGAAHSVASMGWKSTLPGVKTFPNGVAILAASKDRVVSAPRLFIGPNGRLFLGYRHWISGDASYFLYAYDTGTSVWSSVSGSIDMPNSNPAYAYTEGLPLLDGRGQGADGSVSMSPETIGPVLGTDGRWWLLWSWRDLASSADTNSRVSVARSTDLVTWTTVSGATLPSTIEYSLVDESSGYSTLVVDDIPTAGGGLLNGQLAIGWDASARPVVSYFRYTGTGSRRTTQLFVARPNGLAAYWIVNQASRWTGIYDLGAGASTSVLQTNGSGAVPTEAGRLELAYQCNGVSRVLTIGPGSFTGASSFVRDDVATSSPVPLEVDTLPDGASSTLASRHAESPAVTVAGQQSRWFVVWGSGPWIVDGRAPAPGSYPSGGSPMTLVSVAEG